MNCEEEIKNKIPIDDDETSDQEAHFFDEETDYDEIFKNQILIDEDETSDEKPDYDEILDKRTKLNANYQPSKHLQNGTLHSVVIQIIQDLGIVDGVDYSGYSSAEELMHKVFQELGYKKISSYFEGKEIDRLIDQIYQIQCTVIVDKCIIEKQEKITNTIRKTVLEYYKSKKDKNFYMKYRDCQTGTIDIDKVTKADYIKVLSHNKTDKDALYKMLLDLFYTCDNLNAKLLKRNRRGHFDDISNFIQFLEYYEKDMSSGENKVHTGVYKGYERDNYCTGAVNKFYNKHKHSILQEFSHAKTLKLFLETDIDKLKKFCNNLK